MTSHLHGSQRRSERSATRDLFGCDHTDDPAAMLLWRGFHLAELAEGFDHHLHDLVALLDVGHLATAEQDTDLHLVLVLQKLFGASNLGPNVFLARLGTEPDFFGFGVRLPRVFLFVLVVSSYPPQNRPLVQHHPQ